MKDKLPTLHFKDDFKQNMVCSESIWEVVQEGTTIIYVLEIKCLNLDGREGC